MKEGTALRLSPRTSILRQVSAFRFARRRVASATPPRQSLARWEIRLDMFILLFPYPSSGGRHSHLNPRPGWSILTSCIRWQATRSGQAAGRDAASCSPPQPRSRCLCVGCSARLRPPTLAGQRVPAGHGVHRSDRRPRPARQ
jgi:hypothetical protein